MSRARQGFTPHQVTAYMRAVKNADEHLRRVTVDATSARIVMDVGDGGGEPPATEEPNPFDVALAKRKHKSNETAQKS